MLCVLLRFDVERCYLIVCYYGDDVVMEDEDPCGEVGVEVFYLVVFCVETLVVFSYFFFLVFI